MNSNNNQSYKFENQQSNEADGFKFALTLLAFCVYSYYYIYNYFQNEVVDYSIFIIIGILVSVENILIIGLILYILIKGYSIEVKGSVRKQNLNQIASIIYSLIFLIFIISITYSLLLSIYIYFYSLEIPGIFIVAILYISIGVGMAFTYPPSSNFFLNIAEKIDNFNISKIMKELKEEDDTELKEDVKILKLKAKNFFKKTFSLNFLYNTCNYFVNIMIKTYPIFIIAIIGSSFIIHVSPQMIASFPIFEGRINIDMENIHQKKDIMIPVQIQVTGPDVPISVGLFKVEPNNSRSDATIVTLGPKLDYQNRNQWSLFDNISTFENNNSLLGNALGTGKYLVFINTTNLTIGYYKLEVNHWKTTSGEGFYLIDNTNILEN